MDGGSTISFVPIQPPRGDAAWAASYPSPMRDKNAEFKCRWRFSVPPARQDDLPSLTQPAVG